MLWKSPSRLRSEGCTVHAARQARPACRAEPPRVADRASSGAWGMSATVSYLARLRTHAHGHDLTVATGSNGSDHLTDGPAVPVRACTRVLLRG